MMLTNGSSYYPSPYGSTPFNNLPHHNYAVRPAPPPPPQTNAPYYNAAYQKIPHVPNQLTKVKSLPSFKLYDLDTNRHHEIIRLIFAFTGVSYKDKRLNEDEWKKMKEDLSIEQLPILRLNNDYKIFHLHAILRCLAREFYLYGSDKHEHALVDIILETIRPLQEQIFQEIDNEENLRKIITDHAAAYLKQLEDCYSISHHHGPYFLGSHVSLADLVIYDTLIYLIQIDSKLLDNYSHLKEACRRLEKHPRIYNYIHKTNPKSSLPLRHRTKSPTPNIISSHHEHHHRHRSHEGYRSNHNHYHHLHYHHRHHHHHHRHHSKESTPASQTKQSKSPSLAIQDKQSTDDIPLAAPNKTPTNTELKSESTVS